MGRDITQKVIIPTDPKTLYNTLMDSKEHAAFTEAPAKISKKLGGAFSCYGPYLMGYNVDLVEGKRIVQAWRAKDWKAGVYSIASFEFKKKGKKTELTFTHVGVPTKNVKSIASGWKEHYWDRLKDYFG